MNNLGQILVFGSGRLASGIVRYYQGVTVLDKTRCDITDRKAVSEALLEHKPDIAINTAAVTSPALCETDPGLAWRVNVFGARNVASACERHDVKSVHISSNWAVDPVNEYGMSKYSSEHVGMDLCIRTCYYDEGYWVLQTLGRGDPVNLLDTDMFNPISVDGFLKVLDKLLKRNAVGIANIGVLDRVSHFDLGVEFARAFGISPDLVIPMQDVDLPYRFPVNTYLEPHPLSRISLGDDIREFRNLIDHQASEDQVGGAEGVPDMPRTSRTDTRSRSDASGGRVR